MKRLIKSKKIGNEWFAYHGTDKSKLDSILQNGLKPSGQFGPYVFLASNKDLASSYSGINPVILKIKLTNNNLDQIRRNNEQYPYEDFAMDYLKNEILPKKNLKIEDVQDEDFPDDVSFILDNLEYDYGINAKQLDEEIFESYFDTAELMVNEIKPDQIIEVMK